MDKKEEMKEMNVYEALNGFLGTVEGMLNRSKESEPYTICSPTDTLDIRVKYTAVYEAIGKMFQLNDAIATKFDFDKYMSTKDLIVYILSVLGDNLVALNETEISKTEAFTEVRHLFCTKVDYMIRTYINKERTAYLLHVIKVLTGGNQISDAQKEFPQDTMNINKPEPLNYDYAGIYRNLQQPHLRPMIYEPAALSLFVHIISHATHFNTRNLINQSVELINFAHKNFKDNRSTVNNIICGAILASADKIIKIVKDNTHNTTEIHNKLVDLLNSLESTLMYNVSQYMLIPQNILANQPNGMMPVAGFGSPTPPTLDLNSGTYSYASPSMFGMKL